MTIMLSFNKMLANDDGVGNGASHNLRWHNMRDVGVRLTRTRIMLWQTQGGCLFEDANDDED